MGNQKMGFEGQIFYGAAGSTAGTLLENTTDINYNLEPERGNTTVRGDGSAPPITTEQVTIRGITIEWTMINDTTDASFEAMRVAAFSGSPIALRTKDYAAGKGFDGDVTLAATNGMPLNGEQTTQFTATPTRSEGRDPQLYV